MGTLALVVAVAGPTAVVAVGLVAVPALASVASVVVLASEG